MKFYVRDSSATYRRASSEELLRAARTILRRKFRRGTAVRDPRSAGEYLVGELAHLDHECFAILWLDARHRVLAFDPLFRGTIDGTSVYPREVVRSAISVNAAACILAHNHPSGFGEPSPADTRITQRLKAALELVDVRVIDHLIVAADDCVSMAARGLL